MNCPICKNSPLADKPLTDGLEAASCSSCNGWWIDGKRYWQWIESRPHSQANIHEIPVDPATQQPVNDSGPGKFCPSCGRFMARVKPTPGANYFINRCGGCGGIWLDNHEWENLQALSLHDDIHFIFSDSWQAEISRIERKNQHDQLMAEKLGPDALAEVKRIKSWLDTHPKKAELYAFLVGPKDSAPSKR
jgi:Zn-finger nucleic acid-binding protein